MTHINILHLSDIHFRKSKEKSFDSRVKQEMIDAIFDHLEKKSKNLDFLAITGDIAYSGEPEEYDSALEFLEKLKTKLPKDIKILIVPGNHDVDRSKCNEFISVHAIIENGRTDDFLEYKYGIDYINQKFSGYSDFIRNKLKLRIYKNTNDYFWVKNYKDKNLSFLGLNSAWACVGKNDMGKITIGYYQWQKALEISSEKNKVILLHHGADASFAQNEYAHYSGDIFQKSQLMLFGHNHFDNAYVHETPSSRCICLGANAVTAKANNMTEFIGFQFVECEFDEHRFETKVWPFILETRDGIRFVPDRNRWRGQKGKEYFILSTVEEKRKHGAKIPHRSLVIPQGYKEWIQCFHSMIAMDQLAKKGEALPVQIIKIYVPLYTNNPLHASSLRTEINGDPSLPSSLDRAHKKKKFVEKEDMQQEPMLIDIEILLQRVNLILLRGDAGTGKTTLIKHLACTMTQSMTQDSISRIFQGRLPVMILLKDLWPIYEERLRTSGSALTFEDILESYLDKMSTKLSLDTVESYASQNLAVFLIDGLDEVPERFRKDLIGLTKKFWFKFKENKFLLTGRPHGMSQDIEMLFQAQIQDIEPLDQEHVEIYIGKWFREVSGKASGLADTTADAMLSDLRENEHIKMFTQNPLLLTAVCILYQAGQKLPDQRAELYDRIVENLIFRRFHDPRDNQKEERVKKYLRKLAYEMQKKGFKKISEEEARKLCCIDCTQRGADKECVYYGQRNPCTFKEIEPNCGLLHRLSSGEIEFFHLSFQEFFSAQFMMDNGIEIFENLKNPWWQETGLLYLGIKNLHDQGKSNQEVKQILQNPKPLDLKKGIPWLTGIRALRDFPALRRDPEVVSNAVELILKIIDSKATLKLRFEAGEILGLLGDPRIKSMEMVLVPEGKFIRGSEEFEDEKPQRKIYLDEYEICKFPITNEQYRKFVEAGGYAKQEFWIDAGWDWKTRNKIIEPEYWHDRKWNQPNFPVVGVSWYEAFAYAEWLTKETGQNYRLPTEAEWEKAARGEKGLKFPWGNTFDKEKCNCGELGLGRTSPVGIFPGGASPYRIHDMAGNVWEWCWDWYGEKYYKVCSNQNPQGPGSGSGRVIRGGCWRYGNPGSFRGANRNRIDPVNRYVYRGFRLVRTVKPLLHKKT